MSQSAQDVATLQSQVCRIAASLDAAGIPGGVDLHQRVMVAVVRMQTAEEQRTQTHRQVAEIAAVLDPEVCADAWGCHEAAQKRMRELSALQSRATMLETSVRQHDEQRLATEEALHTAGMSVDDGLREAVLAIIRERDALMAELAEVRFVLRTELCGSDAAHRLLTELGVEKDSGPDKMPPGAALNVAERIRRLEAKHERRMTGAKQAVDAVRKAQVRAESERDVICAHATKLVDALTAFTECPYDIDEATVPKAGINAAPEQVVGTMSVALTKLRTARALLGLVPDGRGRWETPRPANSPEIPDGSPSDDDFATVRNTLAGSPGAASYNDAFNALLRLGLKAGKWDAAVARADDSKAQHQAAHDAWGSDPIGGAVNWVLHGDEAKETP